MGKFTLYVDLGNEAMQSARDVGEALGRVQNRLASGDMSGNVSDRNGNTVGSWSLTLPMDFGDMTDYDLANALYALYEARDIDLTVLAENEVAGRLDLDPDETEQGFTAKAQAAVEKFVEDNRERGG